MATRFTGSDTQADVVAAIEKLTAVVITNNPVELLEDINTELKNIRIGHEVHLWGEELDEILKDEDINEAE